MAKYRVAGNMVVRVDASAGGTLVNITSYVESIDGLGREYEALDITQFDSPSERIQPGIEKAQEFSLKGKFDDAATTGPDAIFSTAVGTILSFEFNPIGTASGRRKINMEVMVLSYKPAGEVKGMVEYEVRLKQDGSATIGTN